MHKPIHHPVPALLFKLKQKPIPLIQTNIKNIAFITFHCQDDIVVLHVLAHLLCKIRPL